MWISIGLLVAFMLLAIVTTRTSDLIGGLIGIVLLAFALYYFGPYHADPFDDERGPECVYYRVC